MTLKRQELFRNRWREMYVDGSFPIELLEDFPEFQRLFSSTADNDGYTSVFVGYPDLKDLCDTLQKYNEQDLQECFETFLINTLKTGIDPQIDDFFIDFPELDHEHSELSKKKKHRIKKQLNELVSTYPLEHTTDFEAGSRSSTLEDKLIEQKSCISRICCCFCPYRKVHSFLCVSKI